MTIKGSRAELAAVAHGQHLGLRRERAAILAEAVQTKLRQPSTEGQRLGAAIIRLKGLVAVRRLRPVFTQREVEQNVA